MAAKKTEKTVEKNDSDDKLIQEFRHKFANVHASRAFQERAELAVWLYKEGSKSKDELIQDFVKQYEDGEEPVAILTALYKADVERTKRKERIAARLASK